MLAGGAHGSEERNQPECGPSLECSQARLKVRAAHPRRTLRWTCGRSGRRQRVFVRDRIRESVDIERDQALQHALENDTRTFPTVKKSDIRYDYSAVDGL